MSSSVETNPSFQETMLEFRAGLMFLEEKRVVPDTRKGLIKVARGDEGLLHFLWLDRTSNEIEIDQIILPDEAVFEKIQQSSGRVYILKFKYDDRKFFFWMQEPKADGDSQICSSVNYFISRPIEEGEGPETSVALQTSEASDSGAMGTEVSSRDTSAIITNSQGEAPAASTSQSRHVQLSDLQQILSNLGGAAAATQDIGPDLGDILKPELVVPLVDNFPLEDRLACHLPEGVWTREAFGDLLQSPPFRQQVDSFSYVLRTGQIDLSQFGIDPSKYAFTVTSFLEALDETVKNTMASNNTFSSQESKPEDSKDSDSDPARKKAGNDPMDERS